MYIYIYIYIHCPGGFRSFGAGLMCWIAVFFSEKVRLLKTLAQTVNQQTKDPQTKKRCIYLSVYLSICLSVYLPIDISLSLSIYIYI